MMNWYGVRVLYCAHITGEPSGPMPDHHYHGDDVYEESLLMVQAEDPQKAADWAAETCRQNDRSYMNRYGQLVEYKFYDWLEVEELREATLRNGTAVLSATYRAPRGFDPEALIGDRFSPCGPEELFPLHMRSMEQ